MHYFEKIVKFTVGVGFAPTPL